MPSLGQRKRKSGDLDIEIDMVPVMNMFLVLIPFLLMSSSFLQIKSINTSVAVKSTQAAVEDDKKSDIKLTAVVELAKNAIKLSVTSEELTEKQLIAFDQVMPKVNATDYPLSQLSQALIQLKAQYPKSDTLILIPDAKVKYYTIIKAMDAARQYELPVEETASEDLQNSTGRKMKPKPSQLFPNVVLSSKVG